MKPANKPNMHELAQLRGNLYSFDKDYTSYVAALCDINHTENRPADSKFLVTLLSPCYSARILGREEYVMANALMNNFPELGYKDSENLADYLADSPEPMLNFSGSLYQFNKNKILYKIVICDIGEEGKKLMGGRFLVSLLSPKYHAYCFNEDYKVADYIKEKFPSVTYKDAENIADLLNGLFEPIFGDRIHKPSRVIRKNDHTFEVTRE